MFGVSLRRCVKKVQACRWVQRFGLNCGMYGAMVLSWSRWGVKCSSRDSGFAAGMTPTPNIQYCIGVDGLDWSFCTMADYDYAPARKSFMRPRLRCFLCCSSRIVTHRELSDFMAAWAYARSRHVIGLFLYIIAEVPAAGFVFRNKLRRFLSEASSKSLREVRFLLYQRSYQG